MVIVKGEAIYGDYENNRHNCDSDVMDCYLSTIMIV